jgi:hypothetical protein
MRFIAAALVGIVLATVPSLAAEPIAATDGEAPGITLRVQELKVSNGTAMLKFTVINDGSSSFDPDTLADKDVSKPDYHSISGIYLIDAANKKKYLVVYDTNNECICSRRAQKIDSKSSVNLWAKFPAPPDSVTKIGIVVPHFVPMDDVVLSR